MEPICKSLEFLLQGTESILTYFMLVNISSSRAFMKNSLWCWSRIWIFMHDTTMGWSKSLMAFFSKSSSATKSIIKYQRFRNSRALLARLNIDRITLFQNRIKSPTKNYPQALLSQIKKLFNIQLNYREALNANRCNHIISESF